MKRNQVVLVCLLLLLATLLSACAEKEKGIDLEAEGAAQAQRVEANDFEMTLYADQEICKSNEPIQIWATLRYTGKDDTATIWHGIPYMNFSITDGEEFNIGSQILTVLTSTELEKDKIYRFDYQKSGAWDANDPNASFWENFYQEQELLLPAGEYTVSVSGAFSLTSPLPAPAMTEPATDSKSDLLCELTIKVKD